MILIVDSGGTKTDWCLMDNKKEVERRQTAGINPAVLSPQEVNERVNAFFSQPGALPLRGLTQVCFYGAGCTPTLSPVVADALRRHVPAGCKVEVASDLLAAARALCGHEWGVACILGTGSNSCLFNGADMVAQTPALGYVLGDEGGGAYIGKTFLNGIFKGGLPNDLREAYLLHEGVTMADVIRKVYREPAPNTYLASVARFVGLHIDRPELHRLVVDGFRNFLRRNVAPYARPDLPVHALGGVACAFSSLFREAVETESMRMGRLLQSPMERLVQWHLGDAK